ARPRGGGPMTIHFTEFRCVHTELPISGCEHCRPALQPIKTEPKPKKRKAKKRTPARRTRKKPAMRAIPAAPATPDPDWRKRALCRGEGADAEWWQAPANTAAFFAAVKVCRRCPVAGECLALAMRAEGRAAGRNRYGTYGGLSPSQRHGLYDQRRKAQTS
ncbi:WhiB family transcriptional regulator, partial [Mycobacterium sp. NPDC003449]